MIHPYLLQIPHETMHSNSLGLTVKIVEAIPGYAEKIGKRKEAVAAIIDDRLLLVPRYLTSMWHDASHTTVGTVLPVISLSRDPAGTGIEITDGCCCWAVLASPPACSKKCVLFPSPGTIT